MDGNTYIKLYRKFLEWEWYQDSNTKLVFIHLLICAEWKDTKRKGVDLKRGQCLVTEASLAEDLGMSRQEVRTALRHLISTNEINKEATRVVTNGKTNTMTLITIEKYSHYQGVDNFSNQESNQGNNQPLTKHQPSTNQPSYSMKNNRNYYNSKNNNARAREGTEDVDKFNEESWDAFRERRFTPQMEPEARENLDKVRRQVRERHAAALAAAESEEFD